MMLFELSFGWVITTSFALLVGALSNVGFGRKIGLTTSFSLTVFAWHTAFALLYAAYVLEDGGDALFYYQAEDFDVRTLEPGTSAVLLLTGLFSRVLAMPFLSVSILFASVGCLGVLAFAATLQRLTRSAPPYVQLLVLVLVFLPSLHFWSSGIGKDSLAMFAIGMLVFGLASGRSANLGLWIGVATLIIIRPHIGAVFLVAYFAGRSLSTETAPLYRTFTMVLSVTVVAVAFPIVAGLIGLGGGGTAIGAADVAEFIERRQSYNLEGGGAVEISQLSLPSQLFTYLFRPLPHESVSLASLFASMDNVVILFVLAYGFMQSAKRRALFRIPNSYVLWMYSLGSWLALAITTANLGIAVRQKWMFLPCLVCLAFSIYYQRSSSGSRKVLRRRDLAI